MKDAYWCRNSQIATFCWLQSNGSLVGFFESGLYKIFFTHWVILQNGTKPSSCFSFFSSFVASTEENRMMIRPIQFRLLLD